MDGRGGTRFGGGDEAVREGEEGIAADHASLEGETGLTGLPDGDAGGIDTRHLTRTDTKGAILACVDNGVALHVLHDLPSEFHRLDLILGRRATRDDMVLDVSGGLLRGDIGILDKKASDDRADVAVGGGNLLQESHQAEVLFFLEKGPCISRELGSDDHLAEDFGNCTGECLVDRTVRNDDATKGGGAVGGEGLLPRLRQVLVASHAAGIGVLENGDGRLCKLADQAGGRRDIQDVVEGEFLAVEFLEVVEEAAVEFGLLVGGLAVAETAGQRELERDGITGRALVVEVGADGAVVGTGSGEGLHRKAGAKLGRGLTVTGPHRLQDTGVVVGISDDGDGTMVLRATANHGRAADIDLLDGFLKGDSFLRDGLLEGVEVHADQIDREDAMLGRLSLMLRIVAEKEQAAVHLRDEGLHAAIHHLGKAGVVGNLPDRDACGGDRLGGAAGGEEFHPLLVKAAGEVDESGLVGDGEECALDFHG